MLDPSKEIGCPGRHIRGTHRALQCNSIKNKKFRNNKHLQSLKIQKVFPKMSSLNKQQQ